MKAILIKKIRKEKPNSASLGAFNLALSQGKSKKQAAKVASQVALNSSDGVDTGISYEEMISGYDSAIFNTRERIKQIERNLQNAKAEGLINLIKPYQDDLSRQKQTLTDLQKGKEDYIVKSKSVKLIKREASKNNTPTWENLADKYVSKKTSFSSLSPGQRSAISQYKAATKGIEYWRSKKGITEAERKKQIDYFTNMKLRYLQGVKRNFRKKDFQ